MLPRYIIPDPGWDLTSTLSSLAEGWAKMKTREGNGVQPVSVAVSSDRKDFHLVLHDGKKAAPSMLLSLIVEGKSHGGYVVRIDDKVGLLDGIRLGKAYAELPADSAFAEKPLVQGPYPVLDADLLLDRISGRVYSPSNLESFGIERSGVDEAKDPAHAHLAHEDCGGILLGENWLVHSWSLKEVEQELSSRNSFALGNYSLMDCYTAEEPGYAGKVSSEGYIKVLCDKVEELVEKRELNMDWNHNPDYALSFVSEKLIDAKNAEQFMIDTALGLKGVKINPKNPAEFIIGMHDGYNLVCRNRGKSEDYEFGKQPYLAVVKDGKSVSYLNAVASRPDLLEVANKIYEKALRRDRACRRFESFKEAVGLKRSNGIKIG